MRSEGEHYYRPIDVTIPGRTVLWFQDHPNTLLTDNTIDQIAEWETIYTQSNIGVLIRTVRHILSDALKDKGYVINIFNEGYVYCPQVAAGDKIAPFGFRPIPQWEGDAARTEQLYELFRSIRYATVGSKLIKAKPSLTPMEYRYLQLLAEAYAKGLGVEPQAIIRDTGMFDSSINVHKCKLKSKLEQLTDQRWTIQYKSGSKGFSGVGFLEQRPTA